MGLVKCPNFFSDLNEKLECRQMLVRLRNIKFSEYPFIVSRVVTDRQTGKSPVIPNKISRHEEELSCRTVAQSGRHYSRMSFRLSHPFGFYVICCI
jgi:hypothetical protein